MIERMHNATCVNNFFVRSVKYTLYYEPFIKQFRYIFEILPLPPIQFEIITDNTNTIKRTQDDN